MSLHISYAPHVQLYSTKGLRAVPAPHFHLSVRNTGQTHTFLHRGLLKESETLCF